MKISELLEKLSNLGIKVYIGQSGEIRLNVPDPVPTEARPLLAELKQQKNKVIEYFRWDEYTALSLFQEALERIKQRYPGIAWPWATEHRPELRQAVKDAERRFNSAYQGQDITNCRKAVAEYERSFGILIDAYSQRWSLMRRM